MRSEQIKLGKNPGYDGRCRDKAEQAGESVVRFKSTATEDIIINDLVYGQITVHKEELDDFIILRSNGVPTYHFAVVIDDNESEIFNNFRKTKILNNDFLELDIEEKLEIRF